ncbi:MAG TPA: hypothetical protein VFE94_02735 [Candidatus Paceibacterota bacterium]|nr:hypothetical protein [Candidatus Paceibacterota bacterium]
MPQFPPFFKVDFAQKESRLGLSETVLGILGRALTYGDWKALRGYKQHGFAYSLRKYPQEVLWIARKDKMGNSAI